MSGKQEPASAAWGPAAARHGHPAGHEGIPPAPPALRPRRLRLGRTGTAQRAAHERCPPGLPAWCGPGQPAPLQATPLRGGRGGSRAAFPALTAAIDPGPRQRGNGSCDLQLSAPLAPARRRTAAAGAVAALARTLRGRCQRLWDVGGAARSPIRCRALTLERCRAPAVSERAAGPRSAAGIDTVTASARPRPATRQHRAEPRAVPRKSAPPGPAARQVTYTIALSPLHTHAQQLMHNKCFSRHLLHFKENKVTFSESLCPGIIP